MNRYMFGLDHTDSAASARRLSQMGYDGVVLSANEPLEAFEGALNAGLETWLCFGAHSLGDFSEDEHGAMDAKGRPAPWFGSGCPNDEEIIAHNQNHAFEKAAKIPGLTGIMVDGARFASFASQEGDNSFFGCFCVRCMDKMRALGIDADATRDGISHLMDYISGGDGDIPQLRIAIESWFDFRAACVKQYMDTFAAKCHRAGLKSGAFVFAPSLWWFVGQRPDCCGALDVVAPMLYRDYPHETGTACLSHEWAAFKELLSHGARPAADMASLLFDTAFMSDDPMAGFSAEHVGLETRAAVAMLPKNIEVMPIIQTEDAELESVYAHVLNAGASGCGEFMYSLKKF